MVVGTTIFYLDGNAYYSPEFPRGGLAATFCAEILSIVLNGASQFDIEIEHRNSEDTTWTSLGNFSAISSTGNATVDFAGIKEIVRFKYTFGGGTPAADDAVHYIMQAPSWRPY